MRRLRVLQVITHFAVGGATETVLTVCRQLNPAQFDTAILCGKTALNEQTLLQEAISSGIPVHEVPSLRRALAPAWEMRAFQDLVQWFKENSYDIVHTNGSKAGILGRLAAAKAGVPVIIHTVFGWGHHAHMNPASLFFYRALERRAACVSDCLVTVSEANRAKGLADKIGTTDQYEVVYNGIEIARYRDISVDSESLRRTLNIPAGTPVIGTVSRLAPQKAPMDFLEVASLVHLRCPEIRFVFVGGGPMQAEFEQALTAKNLQGVVHFLGYRQDVPALLRCFDVFLLTSLWEGLPMVILQAMCAALPTVATAVDGTPEVVIPDETGFLAAPHDCAAMADHILTLLKQPELRAQMGANARNRIDLMFSDHTMIRRIEEIYLACAERKGLTGTL